ncbi:MAG: class I SAM-dependent methyltransferase [Rhodanobacter sp.]
MNLTSRVRRAAKRIAPLYWLGGAMNYAGFRVQLARANRTDPGAASGLPPPMLRYRVHRAFDSASYLENGRSIAQSLVDVLRAHAVALKNLSILDFACGPGRVISELAHATESCTLYGSDIDSQAIAWASDNLSSFARFSTNATSAPTDYASGMFDVIYSVSLFTHLDVSAQDEWLAEMQRLLKPGGMLLATTHGRFTTDSCTPAELDHLRRDGVVYRTDHKGRFKVDGLPDFYQTTFHTADYVKRHWGRFFSVIDHIEGGLNGHQDIVVMRKAVVSASAA